MNVPNVKFMFHDSLACKRDYGYIGLYFFLISTLAYIFLHYNLKCISFGCRGFFPYSILAYILFLISAFYFKFKIQV
jgi:hypothetical protein